MTIIESTSVIEVEDLLRQWFTDKQEGRSTEPMGPSAAHSCIRQQVYSQLGVLPTDEVSKTKADIGTLIHLGIMQVLAEQASTDDLETEVPVLVPGLSRTGSTDIVYWAGHRIVDVKTYGDRVWHARVDAGQPYPGQWDQVDMYALGVNEMVTGRVINTVQILAVNRETGEFHTFTKPYDEERALDLAAAMSLRQASIDEAKEALQDPTRNVDAVTLAEFFPREGSGPGRGMPCDWCPFLSQCWPVPFGDLSPQASTIVDHPDEVARWAGEYRAASAQAKDWTDRKYTAQAYLRGIVGSFGDWKVSQQADGKDSDVPDVDAMVDLLSEMGVPIPTVTKPGRKGYPKVSPKK